MTEAGQSGRKKQWDFLTHQGQLQLYYEWARLRIAEGRLSITQEYTVEEQCHFFADWLRWVIARGSFNPSKRLPPYEKLAAVPFHLRKEEIAQVIRQLRDEQLLPPRKTRADKGRPQWTKRDRWLWAYIGSMRALRFDQIRRLAARASPEEIEGGLLSISRTSEIIKRWTDEKIAVFRPIYHAESGWCYLTRRGLREAGFTFRAEAPSVRSLHHLYWINEVRMRLEEEYRTTMRWFSEREIQAQQELRRKGQKLTHIQDGILLLKDTDGAWEEIDIEVQMSKPSSGEVEEVMSDQFWTSRRNRPLRYYVNRLSRGVVRSAYRKMVKQAKGMRPTIEMIDLENWRPLSLEEEE
jgi:hypothetical protein